MLRHPSSPLFLIVLLLVGCKAVHHYVPPRPLNQGEVAGTIGMSWSLSDIYPTAAQGNIQLGLSDRDVIGFGFCNFIFPTTASYIRYQELDSQSYLTYQIHASRDLMAGSFELALGLSRQEGSFDGSAHIGLACIGRSLYGSAASMLKGNRIVPTIGLGVGYKWVGASVMSYPGMTGYFVESYRTYNRRGPAPQDTILTFTRAEIVSIDSTTIAVEPRDYYQRADTTAAQWSIRLSDGRTLAITQIHYRYQSMSHGIDIHKAVFGDLETFILAHAHPDYEIFFADSLGRPDPYDHPPLVMTLDMKGILDRYHETGVLTLQIEEDIMRPVLDHVRWGWDDLSYSVAFRAGSW